MGIYTVYYRRRGKMGRMAPLRGVFEDFLKLPRGCAPELARIIEATTTLVQKHVAEGERTDEYRELARAAVAAGLTDHVPSLVGSTLGGPDRGVLEILEDITNRGDLGLLKSLIPLLWRKPSMAYRICAVLSIAYPERASEIAQVIGLWSPRSIADRAEDGVSQVAPHQ
jgi:hypothetical protein